MCKSLSIVIPIYNFESYLGETLDSIIMQSEQSEVEILIFDGGSTDNTQDLVKKYQKYFSNIKYTPS